jgi:hypothetical protein
MLEVGDINRFPTVSDYFSYCRCVKSESFSDKKKKGEGNRKNRIKYFAWAYMWRRLILPKGTTRKPGVSIREKKPRRLEC